MAKPQRRKLVILGLVENNRGEILLTQRYEPEFPGAHLRWEVPGGAHDWGETLEETCRREIAEETGIKVEIIGLLPLHYENIWDHPEYEMEVVLLGFHCRYESGEPVLGDHKIADIKWFDKHHLPDFDYLPPTREWITYLATPAGPQAKP
jgi:mutator protein MutT